MKLKSLVISQLYDSTFIAEAVTINTSPLDRLKEILFTFAIPALVCIVFAVTLKKLWDAIPKGVLIILTLFVLVAAGYLNFK